MEVEDDSMGEFYIDLATYGWFPHKLPNEDEDDEEQEDA